MKTKLTAVLLLAVSSLFAGPRVAIGIGIGLPFAAPYAAPAYVAPAYVPPPSYYAPAYYSPAPAYVAPAYIPPAPGPGYFWTSGYWGFYRGHRCWHRGYWAPRERFDGDHGWRR